MENKEKTLFNTAFYIIDELLETEKKDYIIYKSDDDICMTIPKLFDEKKYILLLKTSAKNIYQIKILCDLYRYQHKMGNYQTEISNIIFNEKILNKYEKIESSICKYFDTLKNKTKKVSKSSSDTYKMHLKVLTKKYNLNINKLTIDDLNKFIENNDICSSTLKSYLCSLKWHISKKKQPNLELSNYITKQINKYGELILEIAEQNTLSEKEKQMFTSFENILLVQKELEKELDEKNKSTYVNHLLVSLHCLTCPRRRDYSWMYVNSKKRIPKEPNLILWTNKKSIELHGTKYTNDNIPHSTHDNCNYYVNKGDISYFMFKRFKTQSYFGNQIIEVPTKLNEIIIKYIRVLGLNDGDKLIDLDETNYTKRIQSIFNRYLKKNIGPSALRHIYITSIYNKKSVAEKKYISYQMAHNLEMQSLYYKEIENETYAEDTEKILKNTERSRTYAKGLTDEEKRKRRLEQKKRYRDKQREKNKKEIVPS